MASAVATSNNNDGLSPLFSPSLQGERRRQSGYSSSSPHINDNDDRKERNQRLRSRLSDTIGSPKLSANRQIRTTPSDTDNVDNLQLKEHYASCIKLSAENKINAKNAFTLHLIDYMAEVVKSQGGSTNFQMASCTLDASAKIYAGRIDSVHNEAYKVLGGLGRSEDKKDKEEDQKACKKNVARKLHTIEENVASLDVDRFDLQFEVDPLFKKNCATFDESGTAGLLLHTLCFNDDRMKEISLNANTIANTTQYYVKDDDVDNDDSNDSVSIDDGKDCFENILKGNLKICPDIDGITLKTSEEPDMASINRTGMNEHAFNPDSSRLQYDYIDSDNDDDNVDGNMNNSFDDVRGQIDFAADGQDAAQLNMNGNVATMFRPNNGPQLCLESALKLSDYSYFNNAFMATWAGPKHWKLQPISREVKPTEKQNKQPRQKKPPFRVDFFVEVDFEKLLSKGKAAIALSKATLKGRSVDQTTLPEDLHYEADTLFRIFTKPKMMVKWLQINKSVVLEDGSDWYDYNNANDCQNYCPNVAGDYDDDDDGNDGGAEGIRNDPSAMADSAFNLYNTLDETQLVAEPKKVNKIEINYAKTAKKIDVRKLKNAMWDAICDKELAKDDKENTEPNNAVEEGEKEDKSKMVKGFPVERSFKELYYEIPNKVSGQTAKNLSVHICFICLLHLANEKGLTITGDETMADLKIYQEN